MGTSGRTGGGRQHRLGNTLSGLAVVLGCVLFLGGFAWGAVVYQPYAVPTESMAPTVQAGDRVLAERVDGDEIRRGDVVVFQDPVWGDLPMIKRVVGVGGDKVACCDGRGRLTVNGKPVDEPYVKGGGPASRTPFEATVPRGRLFLLGDNRRTSQDSRIHLEGDHWAVPRDAVRARVDATVWPLGGFGMVNRPEEFASLPGGVSRPGPLRPLAASIVAGALMILGGAAYGPLSRASRALASRRRRRG